MMSQAVLDQLADALAEERTALLERDVQRLLHSNQTKRAALQSLESNPPHGQDERLAELFENNRLNGALLARRRQDVDVMLRSLSQHESVPAYNAHGQSQPMPLRRMLAVA